MPKRLAVLLGAVVVLAFTANTAVAERAFGRYIVVLNDNVSDPGSAAAEHVRTFNRLTSFIDTPSRVTRSRYLLRRFVP